MSGEGDHTRADLDLIKEMGNGLGRIKRAFDDLGKLNGAYGDDLGHEELSSKLDDFAGNWEISRKKLTEDVEALAKLAKDAAKVYEDIDHQLAEAIRGAQGGKPAKRGR
ncbi:hypothetical protein ACIQ6Y_31200 [Streptomyces sp. NPDC096205]|uniref:hypothetical protein n=1 Tax=Streptomyces sp. NPDC096205 TaxID=3366081 RepID=UPI00382034FD